MSVTDQPSLEHRREADESRREPKWCCAVCFYLAILQVFVLWAAFGQDDSQDYSTVPGRRRVEDHRLIGPAANIDPSPITFSGGPPRQDLWESNLSGTLSEPLAGVVTPTRRTPQIRCIHELFQEQVERTPDAIAVKLAGEHLTYRELNRHANQLAHHLQRQGVGPEVLVAVCLPRSVEMIVTVLGVLKAGGAYLPMDFHSPKERSQFILQDAQVRVLMAREDWLKSFASYLTPAQKRDVAFVCPDRDRDAIGSERGDNPTSGVTPANLVYGIYTSGSTGTPKGVLVPHSALSRHASYFAKRFELGPADRALQFAPLNFDVSAEEIFPALISGSTVVLRAEGLSASIEQFNQFLVYERLTVVNLPTSFWAVWMDGLSRLNLKLPDALRLVIVGSESVTAAQYAQWQKLAGSKVRWCNAYGTTEATITNMIFEPRNGEALSVVPIGRPVDFTDAYILDSSHRAVPVGTPGELHLAGEMLARGYLNRPELTASRFVPNPFSTEPDARLYKTGDIARIREDGNIELLGRMDQQVKIRGHRIELEEIETMLKKHPAVKNGVVTAQDGPSGEKRLMAYYIPRRSASCSDANVLAFLRERLPAYMVPAGVVKVNSFPLMPNGKLDRRALLAGIIRAGHHKKFDPPVSPLEENLAAIWCELLGLDSVGVHDNFFDLGGDSLMALRFCARVENQLSKKLSTAALFEAPSISRLGRRLQAPETAAATSCLVPIQPYGSRPALYLVHGAGGGMLWGYRNLARHLGSDQPLLALDSRGAQNLEEFPTIEEMAAHYVKELRAFQPVGPYRIGGYCFGGEVAFEMARQLVASGERVALLALFNAMSPNSDYERLSLNPRTYLPFIKNAWRWFNYFRDWSPAERRNLIQRKCRSLLKTAHRAVPFANHTSANENVAEDTIDLSLYPEYQQKLWDVHLRASRQYQPKPYAGHITVFRTSIHPFFSSFDDTAGWGEFAQVGVTVHVMPGAHESILDEPHVQVVAKCLSQVLQTRA